MNNVEIGSRVKEKIRKESVPRNQEQRENRLEAQREIIKKSCRGITITT